MQHFYTKFSDAKTEGEAITAMQFNGGVVTIYYSRFEGGGWFMPILNRLFYGKSKDSIIHAVIDALLNKFSANSGFSYKHHLKPNNEAHAGLHLPGPSLLKTLTGATRQTHIHAVFNKALTRESIIFLLSLFRQTGQALMKIMVQYSRLQPAILAEHAQFKQWSAQGIVSRTDHQRISREVELCYDAGRCNNIREAEKLGQQFGRDDSWLNGPASTTQPRFLCVNETQFQTLGQWERTHPTASRLTENPGDALAAAMNGTAMVAIVVSVLRYARHRRAMPADRRRSTRQQNLDSEQGHSRSSSPSSTSSSAPSPRADQSNNLLRSKKKKKGKR